MWFYSTTYKREFLLGNFIVALLTALVPFLVLLYELPLLAREYGSQFTPMTKYLMIWVLGFSLFAFLLNLVREIVKDAEDLEGDRAYGKRTIAVVWGMTGFPMDFCRPAFGYRSSADIGLVFFHSRRPHPHLFHPVSDHSHAASLWASSFEKFIRDPIIIASSF